MMLMQLGWTGPYAATALAMWVMMMVAMMLPIGAPRLLRAARHANFAPEHGRLCFALTSTGCYLAVWIGFGAAATILQWLLDRAHLLSAGMAISSPMTRGALVIAVGVYQFSRWKHRALEACRSADDHWTCGPGRGATAAWKFGFGHGLSCLSCCWGLMLLPFAGGLTNLKWMAAATLIALVERALPSGNRIAFFTGAGLILLGSLAMVAPGDVGYPV